MLSLRSAGSRPVRLSARPTTRSLAAWAVPDTPSATAAASSRLANGRGIGSPPRSINAADAVAGDEVILAHTHQGRDDRQVIGPTQRAGHLAVVQLQRMAAPPRVR